MPTNRILPPTQEFETVTYSNGDDEITYTSNGGIRENVSTPTYPPFWTHETLLDFRPLGSWIIFERHIKACTCSYCCRSINNPSQSKLLKYIRIKFGSPTNKGRNSWRRLTFNGFKYYYYLRWTLPHTELIAKKIMEIIGE